MNAITITFNGLCKEAEKEDVKNGHIFFDSNVKKFEDIFLMIRQKDYYKTTDGVVCYKSEEEVKDELRNYLKNNTAVNDNDIDSVMDLLAKLPEIVTGNDSVINNSKFANSLTKLYKKESSAGTNNISKIIEPEPEWVTHHIKDDEFDDIKYKIMADEWIESESGQNAIKPMIKGSGKSNKFKKKYLAGDSWYKEFKEKQEQYKKDYEKGLSGILTKLEEYGAIPLIQIDSELVNGHSKYAMLTVKIALENFCSYVACDKKTRENYASVKQIFLKQKNYVETEYPDELKKIEQFLVNNYSSSDYEVHLTSAMCKGLESLYKKWENVSSEGERFDIIRKLKNGKKRNSLGDINLINFLAKDENQDITFEIINKLQNFYQAKEKFVKAKCCATYTSADPFTSKRYMMYGLKSKTNFPKCVLIDDNNRLSIKLSILTKADGGLLEKECILHLSPNDQFSNVIYGDKGKVRFSNRKRLVENGDSFYESFEGELCTIKIMPQFNHDENVKKIAVALSVDLNDDLIKDTAKLNKEIRNNILKPSNGKMTKLVRAIAVDLGLKQFGAATVGKVLFDAGKIVQDQIVYERSFLLHLPGEKVSGKIQEARYKAMQELRNIKADINFLSKIKRIYNVQDFEKKKALIGNEMAHTFSEEKKLFYEECYSEDNIEELNRTLSVIYDCKIKELNIFMEEFRAGERTEKQKRNYLPGKSFWYLTYLQELRNLLVSWSSLSYTINDENRLMRKEYGVIANRLLEHINNMKQDRIKTAADMVVMTALGYVYVDPNDKKGYWEKKYESSNVIVLENLTRYLFTTDRSKKENTKLMQWSHQSIIKEVRRQAAVHGIEVVCVGAAYSSKLSYKTGAPGLRCDRLTKNDFDQNGVLHEYKSDYLPADFLGRKLKVGDLVPSEIGSIFVSLDETGKLYEINADINASRNLLRRFFLSQIEISYLSTENKNGILKIKNLEEVEEVNNLEEVEEVNNLEEVEEVNNLEELDNLNDNLVYDMSDSHQTKKLKSAYIKELWKSRFDFRFGSNKIKLSTLNNGHFVVVEASDSQTEPAVTSSINSLFNDPSGVFFNSTEWIQYGEFWDTAKDRIIEELTKKL